MITVPRKVSAQVAERVREAIARLSEDERGTLFPPQMDKIREITGLEFKVNDVDTYATLLETICGATDDSEPVEQYDGTLGVTIAFVNGHQSAVGQLQWNNNLGSLYTNPGTVAGQRFCSGTLIANDLFLSAGHCFDQTGGGWVRPTDNATGATIGPAEIATNMHVNFNFQVDPSGDLRAEQAFPVVGLVEVQARHPRLCHRQAWREPRGHPRASPSVHRRCRGRRHALHNRPSRWLAQAH